MIVRRLHFAFPGTNVGLTPNFRSEVHRPSKTRCGVPRGRTRQAAEKSRHTLRSTFAELTASEQKYAHLCYLFVKRKEHFYWITFKSSATRDLGDMLLACARLRKKPVFLEKRVSIGIRPRAAPNVNSIAAPNFLANPVPEHHLSKLSPQILSQDVSCAIGALRDTERSPERCLLSLSATRLTFRSVNMEA